MMVTKWEIELCRKVLIRIFWSMYFVVSWQHGVGCYQNISKTSKWLSMGRLHHYLSDVLTHEASLQLCLYSLELCMGTVKLQHEIGEVGGALLPVLLFQAGLHMSRKVDRNEGFKLDWRDLAIFIYHRLQCDRLLFQSLMHLRTQ